MQKPNEQKRRKIIDTAAKLFATKPYHEVRLDDVAAAARVGKGTLYIYFRNKEELYFSLVHKGFADLLEEIESELAQRPAPPAALEHIVRRLVAFAAGHPEFFELLRNVRENQRRDLAALGRRLRELIADTIRRGIRKRIWIDPRPDLTAVFIPGLVRSAMIHGPRNLSERELGSQILRLLRNGLNMRESR